MASRLETRNSKLETQEGFTLIEVMIAMTLLVLLTLVLYGALDVGHKAVEKAEARSEQSQKLRLSGELLAAYLRSAYPYHVSPNDPAIFFSGEETSLSFVSALSLGLGGRGMSEIEISWDGEAGGSGNLTLEEQMPVRLTGGGTGYHNSLVLRQNISDFHIEYLDPQSEDEHWVEQWDGAEQRILPRAVRLSYKTVGGERSRSVFPIMMNVLAP